MTSSPPGAAGRRDRPSPNSDVPLKSTALVEAAGVGVVHGHFGDLSVVDLEVDRSQQIDRVVGALALEHDDAFGVGDGSLLHREV